MMKKVKKKINIFQTSKYIWETAANAVEIRSMFTTSWMWASFSCQFVFLHFSSTLLCSGFWLCNLTSANTMICKNALYYIGKRICMFFVLESEMRALAVCNLSNESKEVFRRKRVWIFFFFPWKTLKKGWIWTRAVRKKVSKLPKIATAMNKNSKKKFFWMLL